MDSTEILRHFKGREDYIALQQGQGFKPHKLKEIPLNAEKFEKVHLGQERCFGFYLMTEDSKVWCSCLDFDDHGEDTEWRAKATSYYHFLAERGLKPVMEISASGSGAHLWLHFSSPVPAVQVRSFWKKVAKKVDIPIKEIYPRQDSLSDERMGNLVRYPGWNQSRFTEVENDWETIALEVHPITGSDLDMIAAELGESLEKVVVPPKDSYVSERVHEILKWPDNLLARRWRGDTDGLKGDTSRSTIAFCIARELIYQRGIPDDEIKAALRYWCDEIGYKKSDRWIDLTLRNAYELMGKRQQTTKGFESLASCAKMYLDQIGTHNYFGSGIQAVDQSVDGVAPGEVCVLAARPGHGKSSFAVHWLDHQSSQGTPTLLLSGEMGFRELGRKVVQRLVGGPEESWQDEGELAQRKVSEYSQGPTSPYVCCVSTMEEVEEVTREGVRAHGVQLVAVDYLQMIVGKKKDAGRYEEVTDISRKIKALARDCNVAVLALCQLSRDVDRRETVQFNLSDMRESGGIEQDADMILCSNFHARSERTAGGGDDYELHCIKRRNGPIRKVKMEFKYNAETQIFSDA